MFICTKQPNGLYVGADSPGTPRRPAIAGQAPEDHRYRTGLTHRALGWHEASPVMVEIPVRADQQPEAGKEAAPNHGRRDRPSYAPGLTASFRRLCSKKHLLLIFCAVTEHMVDSLSQFMGNDIVSDELSRPSTMTPEVSVEAASDLRVAGSTSPRRWQLG